MIINNTDIKIGGAFIEVGTKYFAASTHTFNSNLFLGTAEAEVNLESNRAYKNKRFRTRHLYCNTYYIDMQYDILRVG